MLLSQAHPSHMFLIPGAGHLAEMGILCQSASDTPALSEDYFLKVMVHH